MIGALARNLTRRGLLGDIAGGAALGATVVAPAGAVYMAAADAQTPSEMPETPEERLARAKREFVEATKALHPDVTDWRVIEDDPSDGSRLVGMFMIVGHPARKAVSA